MTTQPQPTTKESLLAQLPDVVIQGILGPSSQWFLDAVNADLQRQVGESATLEDIKAEISRRGDKARALLEGKSLPSTTASSARPVIGAKGKAEAARRFGAK